MTDRFKTLILRLGTCSVLWSCIEIAIWIFNSLIPIEVYYTEKNSAIFSQNIYFIFNWRKKDMNILDDMGVSKLSQKTNSESEI